MDRTPSPSLGHNPESPGDPFKLTVDCPGCGVPLLVPERAAGRGARCKRCSTRFRIPSAYELLDQTMAHWLTEAFEHERGDDEEDAPEPPPALEQIDRKFHPTPSPADSLGKARQSPAQADGSSAKKSAPPPIPAPPPAHEHADRATIDHDDDDDDHDHDDHPAHQTLTGEPIDGLPHDAPHDHDAPARHGIQEHAHSPEPLPPKAHRYPTDLAGPTDRPYLVVREVSMEGVRLAFDGQALRNEAFRTSMPMSCAFTPKDENRGSGADGSSGAAASGSGASGGGGGGGGGGGLRVRPVFFMNQHTHPDAPLHTLENRYEQRIRRGQKPGDLARSVGRLDGFRSPLDLPLLYYVSDGAERASLPARADYDEEGDRLICEVTIPHARLAVDWLERVNGRCGPEYMMLRDDTALLQCDAWTKLSETVRERMEHWCRFLTRERFRAYLNDADFTAADAGLAGVVITDQRLIYHKFRQSRSVALNQEAVVHVRADERSARLTFESHGRMAPAGKIAAADVSRLIEALSTASRIRVDVRRRCD